MNGCAISTIEHLKGRESTQKFTSFAFRDFRFFYVPAHAVQCGMPDDEFNKHTISTTRYQFRERWPVLNLLRLILTFPICFSSPSVTR